MSAGYSGTPLYKKLSLRPGLRLLAVGMPPEVRQEIEASGDGVIWVERAAAFDAAHLFAMKLEDLSENLARVRQKLPPAGFVWASWPKKTSGIVSDITEDAVRQIAFAAKLVDVKVCAVSEVWSGLKLVIRLKDRPSRGAGRVQATGRGRPKRGSR
jgi:hypothetical protein